MNEGKTWERISPDLTYNNDEKKGDIPYQTIFTISESPLKFGVIYAGTDDGRVWITRNSGTVWKEINKGLPYRKWVSQMEASRFAEGRVYMTQNGKRDDDFTAYIWKSEDYGDTWTDITANIPYGPINVIREDPQNENVLYVGTDYGVFVSLNGGESWETLTGDLPTVYVHDLVIHPRDDIAVIATHGRGFWALDVRLVRKIADVDSDVECAILDMEDCTLPYKSNPRYRRSSNNLNVSFYMKSAGDVSIKIVDEQGETVNNENIEGTKGLNSFKWDLMVDKEKMAEAGTYKIQIKTNSDLVEKEFMVKELQYD
jgi:hypothetical protein